MQIAVDRPTPQDSGSEGNPASLSGAGSAGAWGGNAAGLQRMGPGNFPPSFDYSAGGVRLNLTDFLSTLACFKLIYISSSWAPMPAVGNQTLTMDLVQIG